MHKPQDVTNTTPPARRNRMASPLRFEIGGKVYETRSRACIALGIPTAVIAKAIKNRSMNILWVQKIDREERFKILD